MEMTVKLNPEIEALLAQLAQQNNMTPEELVIEVINEKFAKRQNQQPLPKAQDDWERLIMSIGIECNTSLSNADLSSEGLYE